MLMTPQKMYNKQGLISIIAMSTASNQLKIGNSKMQAMDVFADIKVKSIVHTFHYCDVCNFALCAIVFWWRYRRTSLYNPLRPGGCLKNANEFLNLRAL